VITAKLTVETASGTFHEQHAFTGSETVFDALHCAMASILQRYGVCKVREVHLVMVDFADGHDLDRFTIGAAYVQR
jgi:hypothetical protein